MRNNQSRKRQLTNGKLWQVYFRDTDTVIFEGSKTACIHYLKQNNHYKAWKNGKTNLALGKLIWEQ